MKITARLQPAAPMGALLIPLRADGPLADDLARAAGLAGLDPALLAADFKGEAKEIFSFYGGSTGPSRVFLLGLGKRAGFAEALAASRSFCHRHKAKLPARLTVDLRGAQGSPQEVAALAEGIANGLALGLSSIALFKTAEPPALAFSAERAEVEVLATDANIAAVEKAVARGWALAQTQLRVFDLVNRPGNKKTPQFLGEWAMASARQHGYSATVYGKEDCQKMGLEALLSVAQGSPGSPVFIVLEYKPANPRAKIGLVGKGVTFDTGGISIKPSENMHLMKSDMAGAAAVFGAVEAVAKLGLDVHLIGIVPATENMVDGSATKPGDVVGSYSGKTIEVIDTDAEGRIILADGISYLQKNFAPDAMIDLATLTGSIVRTLGSHAAGLFSANDALADRLQKVGDACGERLWRLPMWDGYAEGIKSDVADVKNYSGRPVSDSINAAKFLETFTGGHPAWAHLDIAGVAVTASEFGADRTATAYGVRLLTMFIENHLEQSA